MNLIRIAKALRPAGSDVEGPYWRLDPSTDDLDQLQPDVILRDEATGQCYLLVHEEGSSVWELRPVG